MPNTLHILHVAFTLHDKKIQKWLLHIIEHTDMDNVQIDVLTTADEAPLYRDIITTIGGRLIVAPHPKDKGAFLRFVRGALSVRQYDVIHVHPFITAGQVMVQAFRANVPVRFMHAHLDRRKARRDKKLLNRLKHRMSNNLVRRLATNGVAANEATAKDIFGAHWKKDGRWKIMPYGFDVMGVRKHDGHAKKQKLGIPAKAIVLSQIDNFFFEKNHALTLKLFKNEAERNLSLILVLSGQGPLKANIQNEVMALGLEHRVLFLDDKIDEIEILSMTDLLIKPSLYEAEIETLIKAQLLNVQCLVSEAIPSSTLLMAEYIYRLPLETEDRLWHQALQNLLSKSVDGKGQEGDLDKDTLMRSGYNIDNNVAALKNFYESSIRQKA